MKVLSSVIAVSMILSVSATCNYGEIRLVNGGTIYEGRVEVCVNNQWGTVCDDFWTNSPYQNAKVACRQLGFSDEGAQTRASNPNDFSQLLPPFGQGTGPILWDDVQCSGSELRLSDCPHINHTGDCIRSEDVGVTCQPPPPEPPTVATTGDSTSLSSTVDTTTTTTTNKPLLVPDVFVASPSTPDPQRIDNGSKASEGNQTSTSGLNVENMVLLSQTHIIIIAASAVMFALILATAVCITFLLVLLKLKRKRRAKSDNVYEEPIDVESKGTTLFATHPGSGKLTGNVCYVSTTEVGSPLNLAGPSIETQPTPGSGELRENVCYVSTFKREVRPPLNLTRPSIETQATEWNVAYGSVEMAVTIRNDNAVLYETIDETRMGRRDARNNQC